MLDLMCYKNDIYCCDDEIIDNNNKYLLFKDNRSKQKIKIDKNNDYLFLSDAKNLKIIPNIGFLKKDYFEMNYSNFNELDPFIIDSFDFKFYMFTIDNVIVQIEKESSTYLFLKNKIFEDIDSDYLYEGEDFTLSLKGVNKNNYLEYLALAIFYIRYYNPLNFEEIPILENINNNFDLDFYLNLNKYDDSNYKYESDNAKLRINRCTNFQNMKFNYIKYINAIKFFNAGIDLLGEQISFQYFYKVLEHFFLISQKDYFVSIIEDYNTQQDLDLFIDKITKIYQNSEIEQLRLLIHKINQSFDLEPLVKYAYKNKVIQVKSIDNLCTFLYKYRNSIVHGKNDTNLELRVPNLFLSQEEIIWNNIIQILSELTIRLYCIKN